MRLRLDDAQALLPAFTPVLASVGSVSVQFSLSLNRPLKACINDVFMLLRADPRTAQEHSPEELREVIHSRVLTYCLLRGELVADDDGIHHPTSSDIGLKPEAIDKLEQLVQQSEVRMYPQMYNELSSNTILIVRSYHPIWNRFGLKGCTFV